MNKYAITFKPLEVEASNKGEAIYQSTFMQKAIESITAEINNFPRKHYSK